MILTRSKSGSSASSQDHVRCDECGKEFKVKGIKIHLAKSKCGKKQKDPNSQRITSKSEADGTSEANHKGVDCREKEEISVQEEEREPQQGSREEKSDTERKKHPASKQTLLTDWIEREPVERERASQGQEVQVVAETIRWEEIRKKIEQAREEEIMVKHGIDLSCHDFRSLQGSNWLNDNIIDQYMELVKKEAADWSSRTRS